MKINLFTNFLGSIKKEWRSFPLIRSVIVSFLALAFLGVILWLSFYFNEILFKMFRLTSFGKTLIVILLLLIINLFPWRKILFNKLLFFLLTVFIFLVLVSVPIYFLKIREREYLPKIYHLSKNSFFQSEEVVIEGENLGPTHKPGRVAAGNIEFTVKSWSDSLVLVEVPVPSGFGSSELKIFTAEGRESNSLEVVFRNPNELKEMAE